MIFIGLCITLCAVLAFGALAGALTDDDVGTRLTLFALAVLVGGFVVAPAIYVVATEEVREVRGVASCCSCEAAP